MNVFDFRQSLVSDYERFTRSFVSIRADDIRSAVDSEYASQRFWPEPLVQLNPSFASGGSVEDLVRDGVLSPGCAEIFRFGRSSTASGSSLQLHLHQLQAIRLASQGHSYVLTTGTGSGKSLSYFIPIVDACLKARRGDPTPRTRAIVIYPMNALANSQLEELEKFLGGVSAEHRVSFGRYTGQESEDERNEMARQPPDILLTNFMMLELLMTRQSDLDKTVIRNAQGLQFLVLDELHTYRGRQGADVAVLVRRVREALSQNLICIGTSATMATEGTQAERNQVVASVATRLFGSRIPADHIITETLRRVTPEAQSVETVRAQLRELVNQDIHLPDDYGLLAQHPLAVWTELTLGLQLEEGAYRRARPQQLSAAAARLSQDSGADPATAREVLQQFLLHCFQVRKADRSLFAFRLHQFITGAGKVYATLEAPGQRSITLDGQQFVSGDESRSRRYFGVHFCRHCGQEYFPVWKTAGSGVPRLTPREIDEKSTADDQESSGLFVPHTVDWDPDSPDSYPENWVVQKGEDSWSIRSDRRKHVPTRIRVQADGSLSEGAGYAGWLIPGPFRFCLQCQVSYSTAGKQILRLPSLSSEGRSSATTMLTLSALRYLYEQDTELPEAAKKILGFTDNRQDASLQAGHFNDFIQVLLLRSSVLAALQATPGQELSEKDLGLAVYRALGFYRDDPGVRAEFMQQPDLLGSQRREAQELLQSILTYRVLQDLRLGWRFNNPNLEQLGLIRIDYLDLEDACAHAESWVDAPAVLQAATPAERAHVMRLVLEALRKSLCVSSRYLDRSKQEAMQTQSFNALIEPWAFSEEERLESSSVMVLCSESEMKAKAEKLRGRGLLDGLSFLSKRSALGRLLRQQSTWGPENPHVKEVNDATYEKVMLAILQAASRFGIVMETPTDVGERGWQLSSSNLIWRLAQEGTSSTSAGRAPQINPYFRSAYLNIAALLGHPAHRLFDFEAREHTAQVEPAERQEREARFRYTDRDRADWQKLTGKRLEWLPVLFCSPTMELGVDISSLNTVYMRNVPPTPANYAQRSGRAGRAGQPALVVTYCAAQSPHDQYYFRDPVRMVAGQVSPPALDLANRELLKSHLHAIWLAETGRRLGNSIKELVSLSSSDSLPIAQEIADDLRNPQAVQRARARGLRVMESLRDELGDRAQEWLDPKWVDGIQTRAFEELDAALERWRYLYRTTVKAIAVNFNAENNPAASERERREASIRHNEARRQRDLLLAGDSKASSDFYTYRYLASQGFLPGYNFPRLPLMAYIQGRRGKIGRDNFLSRPRFLALSEFGPFSLIYHEGSQYRVDRALLSLDAESASSNRLSTTSVRLCPVCGYGHFGSQRDRDNCVSCQSSLADAKEIKDLYRIENVSTRRVERITANDEERIRQGYEMQTTIQFAEASGRLEQQILRLSDADGQILELQYGPAATVWRMNYGQRRRKDQEIRGFCIDPSSGRWVADEQDEALADHNTPPDHSPPQRIIPYVEDRRNILIVRPAESLGLLPDSTLATLQTALKRGIETVFQLEESELVAEPLPSRAKRQSILMFEASEGGAGVLTRLASDPTAFRRVVEHALEALHYRRPEGQSHWKVDELLEELDANGNAICEAGCYRCLLSYFNQPDHALLDRRDLAGEGLLLELLCRLTKASAEFASQGRTPEVHDAELRRLSGSSLETAWLDAVEFAGYRKPDRAQVLMERAETRVDFLYDSLRLAILVDGPHHERPLQAEHDQKVNARLEELGFIVIRFPKDRSRWPEIFRANSDLFGSPLSL